MNYLAERNYKKRAKAREKQLMDRIAYRQNLREINANEKSMQRLYEQYCAKAIEAEKAGNHSLAVRMANEALKVKKHREINTNMKNAIEVIHNVQTTNSAMAEIAAISKDTLQGISAGQTTQSLCAVQMELELANDSLQMMMDQSDLFLADYDAPDQNQRREEDEQYLQQLLSDAQKEEQAELLRDTRQRLKRIQQNRPIENERGK